MNFVVYDTEGTGPDPREDQMLSIAAVLTDETLAERERISLRCRLRPHQLPAAEALLVTGLSIADITDPARPTLEDMMKELDHRFRAWRPAVFVGYSSLAFDEPLIAESLRCCGLADDLTGGARLDLQRLALGIHEFAPGAIAFATRFDGQPSFRLADVARANGLVPGKAHDAMGDVETTLAVARLMKARAPVLWEHMLRMGIPGAAERYAFEEPVRLYTEFHHNKPHHWLVSAVGTDTHGRVIAFDLSHDPVAGQALEGDKLLRWLRQHPRPLRELITGDCPFLLPRSFATGKIAMDNAIADARAGLLAGDDAFRKRLLAAHAEIEPFRAKVESTRRSGQPFDERQLAERMLSDASSPWMTLNRAFDEADAAMDDASDAEVQLLEGLLDYLRRELAWAETRVPLPPQAS